MFEAFVLEEFLGGFTEFISEKGDAEEVFCFGKFYNVFKKNGSVSMVAMGRVDDEVFQE